MATFIILAISSQAVVQTDAEGRGSFAKSAAGVAEFVPGEGLVCIREGAADVKTSAHFTFGDIYHFNY